MTVFLLLMGTLFTSCGFLLLDFCVELTYDYKNNTWHFVHPDSTIFYVTAILSLAVGIPALLASYPEIAATETFVNNSLQYLTYIVGVFTFLLTIANFAFIVYGCIRYFNKVRKSVVNG